MVISINSRTNAATATAQPVPSGGSSFRAFVSGTVGNLVEWYDWYAYSAFAVYFAPVFFPESSSTAQLLKTAGIFAAGFLMRPIGGWLFGSLADKMGRKFSMTLSVLLMSLGSLLIALTPTYEAVGVLAPVLLLTARLLQGLSVGGEYGTSATYLSEIATPNRRGFYSSFQYVTTIGGQMLALGIQLLMQRLFLTDAQIEAWGWRIPFVIGAALSVIALYLRNNMHETLAYRLVRDQPTEIARKYGSVRELLRYPKALLTVVGLTMGGTLTFYTYTIYMQKFLVNTVHLPKAEVTIITFVVLLTLAFMQPFFGLLSDKIGRKPLTLTFGILGTLSTYPLLSTLATTHNVWLAVALILLALVQVSLYSSISAVVKAELFPTEIRALGVGLPFSITVAIFGGTAEYIALYFKEIGHEEYFFWYLTACIFISFLINLFTKETKTGSLFTDKPLSHQKI
ncbi:MFS transporter, MHS family, alpha-ketoglutarate permease [Flexibacter flexilis DSM 6793]|uniref:MFS transporter, MHS family, alpha-ketoglutarate permease n=1 Tax=Flexibacter flexilis DSM 6793 TaxID=927664 RepID=A0A1I1G4B3_9BACT|nr:MFS transporter [Flexibacter flexilis]SFC06152.1 MFS transporter, MHS family, alpha-ketoglutarate permease [Flexibacter flexilis DSM 6793]